MRSSPRGPPGRSPFPDVERDRARTPLREDAPDDLRLFLHRAIYGPLPVARLESESLKPFAKGPLEGEATVLRHEKLTAAKQDASALEAEILKRWPGLKERVEENKQLEGFLSRMRRSSGAEQPFEKPPKTWPYRD